MLLFSVIGEARTWSSPDGAKTFEGELKSYDPESGLVSVLLANGKILKFPQDKVSAADNAFLKEQGKVDANGPAPSASVVTDIAEDKLLEKSDGKPADMSKPVQVFVLLGQSNMVGLGKVAGGDVSLENVVKNKSQYSYLVEEDGSWHERKDVRFVQYMQGDWSHDGAGVWLGSSAGQCD